MKLGKETGSFFNHLMSHNKSIPVVGNGGTFLRWTDRQAFEVLEVSKNGKECVVAEYKNIRTDSNGMSESQDYAYTEVEDFKRTLVFRYGAWYEKSQCIQFKEGVCDEQLTTYESRKFLFDENNDLTLDERYTELKTTYAKINLIFGTKETYRDYSF